MARKRFNADEKAAMVGLTVEVLDGRTWYPYTIKAHHKIITDTVGVQCVVVWPDTIGRGTSAIYPGHVRQA